MMRDEIGDVMNRGLKMDLKSFFTSAEELVERVIFLLSEYFARLILATVL